jgi:hypothetical protein
MYTEHDFKPETVMQASHEKLTDRQRDEMYKAFLVPRTEGSPVTFNQISNFFNDAFGRQSTGQANSQSAFPDSSIPTAYLVDYTNQTDNNVPEDRSTYTHHHHGSNFMPFIFPTNNTTINNFGTNQPAEEREEKKVDSFGDYIVILLIAGVAIAPAVIGAAYMISELWNNLDSTL